MKFNWGHGITIGYVLFVVYILYFVFSSFTHDKDLVADDYYAQEVVFQDRIEEEKNAEKFNSEVGLTQTSGGVQIQFQSIVLEDFTEGEVYFFRPSNAEFDLRIPLTLDETGSLTIPAQMLHAGRYEVQLSWKGKADNYFIKRNIVI